MTTRGKNKKTNNHHGSGIAGKCHCPSTPFHLPALQACDRSGATPSLLFTLLLLTLFNFHFSICQAQRIHGFASAGATLSQIEGDELKGFRKLGFTGGVGAIVSIDKKEIWHLSIEALFSQRGSYNNTGDPYSISLPLNYVDIPLMVHYHDMWGGMLAGAGLVYSRLVQQPHDVMQYNPSYFVPDTINMKFLNNDLAVVADIRFPVWKSLWLNLRWQYSIIAIKRDWQFTEYIGVDAEGNPKPKRWKNDCYNNSLAFRLIWQF